MSNVLIGIIGVILFIGLALAGALFLGARFQDTKSTSTAAAAVQAVTQITNAIGYFNADTASRAQAGIDPASLVAGRYLKAVPTNPGGPDAILVMSRDGEASGKDAALVVAKLSTIAALKTCGAIVRQTANGTDSIGTDGFVTATTAAQLPTGPAGCFRVGATAINDLEANQFYAFARV